MLDHLPDEEAPLQKLLHVLETIPRVEFSEGAKSQITPEACYQVAGIQHGDHFKSYSHVIRIVKSSDGHQSTENGLNRGSDKLVFYNYDVHGTFHWQGVYSTALFTEDAYEILTY